MKKKLSGSAAQTNGVISPGVLLTLTILNSNRVPAPFSGTKSFENAETRSVRIVPGPLKTFPVTFQLPPVSPPF